MPFPSPGNLPDPWIEPESPREEEILYHLSHQGSLSGCELYEGESISLDQKDALEEEMTTYSSILALKIL